MSSRQQLRVQPVTGSKISEKSVTPLRETKFDNPPRTPIPDFAQVEPYVDINEVAKTLSVSPTTIRKWREKDLMPFPTYYVGRALRFRLTEVRAAVAATRHLNSAEAYEVRCA